MERLRILLIVLAVAACKPPPTDADMRRDMPSVAPSFASTPIESPPSEGALWAESSTPDRLIYGQPGQPIQLSLMCTGTDLEITRYAPADEGAGALMALVGNGHIGRFEVDASLVRGRLVWQGSQDAMSDVWDPLTGPRQLIATVPGGGKVTLNPSALPMELIGKCRGEPLEQEELEAIAAELESESAQ